MSYFTEHSPSYSTSATSPLSTGSASTCGPNCSCRTVSSVGSTTPRFARVQLDSRHRRETFESPSVNIWYEDLLEESDAPNDDTSKQDFAFDDVFEYGHNEHSSATSSDTNSRLVKNQTNFSFSHFTGQGKELGRVKITKTKSALLMPHIIRAKTGSRQAGRP